MPRTFRLLTTCGRPTNEVPISCFPFWFASSCITERMQQQRRSPGSVHAGGKANPSNFRQASPAWGVTPFKRWNSMKPCNHALDRWGSVTSVACAIHCAIMPLVLAAVPAAVGGVIGSEWVEWALFSCSAAIALSSLSRGAKAYRRWEALCVGVVGLALLAVGRLGEEKQWGNPAVVLLVAGGFTVAIGHWINLRVGGCTGGCNPSLRANR